MYSRAVCSYGHWGSGWSMAVSCAVDVASLAESSFPWEMTLLSIKKWMAAVGDFDALPLGSPFIPLDLRRWLLSFFSLDSFSIITLYTDPREIPRPWRRGSVWYERVFGKKRRGGSSYLWLMALIFVSFSSTYGQVASTSLLIIHNSHSLSRLNIMPRGKLSFVLWPHRTFPNRQLSIWARLT